MLTDLEFSRSSFWRRTAASMLLWLHDCVLSLFVVAVATLAISWLAVNYAEVFPVIPTPQAVIEVIVREFTQNDTTDCNRVNARRCASRQAAEPAPLYAPFERAARKVLRHAGI